MTRKIPAIHAPMALLAGSLLALCITAGCTAPAPAPVENKGMSDLLKRAQSIHEMVLCSEFSRKDEIGPRDSDDLSKVSRTANSGAPTCQYLLGRWNELGQGIPVNYQAALQLYESAAPSYPLAYVALGRMAELGRGRPLSISDAFTLYQYASAADEPSGDVALGRFYEQGLVVNKAPNLAASLYRKAAKRGDSDAWQGLDRLQSTYKFFSPAEIAADRELWTNQLARRMPRAIVKAPEMLQYHNAPDVRLGFVFKRGISEPTVLIRSSSGNPQYDGAVSTAASRISMPPAPIYNETETTFQVNVVYRHSSAPPPTP